MTVFLILSGLIVLLVLLVVALEIYSLKLPPFELDSNLSLDQNCQRVEQWLNTLEKKKKFNGAIVIEAQGKILMQKYIGQADVSLRAITPNTAFNLASVSKHMTAFAILLLQNRGLLSVEDRVSRHIPELKGYDDISVYHLLSHTSGLPDYAVNRGLAKELKSKKETLTAKGLIRWLGRNEQSPQFSPGEKEKYVNSNYVLLAEIVSRVSGESFAGFMSQHIFEPLEMFDTKVVNQLENQHGLEDRAYGFRKRFLYWGQPVPMDLNYFDGVAGDGNIYATPADLLRWHRALLQGKVLPKEVYAQAYDAVSLDGHQPVESHVFGEKIQCGWGWNVEKKPVVKAYGGWQGFSNLYQRNIEQDNVLIILSNSGFFLRTAMIGDKLNQFVNLLNIKTSEEK